MHGRITIYLSEKLRKDLDRIIKAEKISESVAIRDAIQRYIALKRFQ